MFPFPTRRFSFVVLAFLSVFGQSCTADPPPAPKNQPAPRVDPNVRPGDWPQLGGTPRRNNVSDAAGIPTEWEINTGKNLKWSALIGDFANGNVVVANGKVYVGSNNQSGYIKRFPRSNHCAALLCFRESDGEFLWQHSCETLHHGSSCARLRDWPMYGNCSSPVVEGDRLWFVSARGEVVCLDTEGFRDGENDGPFTTERPADLKGEWDEPHEADVVWSFDMTQKLGVRPHFLATSSPTIWGEVLFLCTSNGTDKDHTTIPAPDAPSFLAMNKHTGQVLWTDNSPGKNILHDQWSSPAVGVFDGIPQVIFPGGDGWLYSFRADRWADNKPELLWKFDGNPKDSIYVPDQKSTRNGHISVPVIYDGLIYIGMGEATGSIDPGHLWCIDPNRRGDVSAELVVDQSGATVPHQRFQATAPIDGQKPRVIPNPNSAVVWHYSQFDRNRDGKITFDEKLYRVFASPTIKNNLLFIADINGFVHCLNAKNGKVHWTCDLFADILSSPVIVGDDVYFADSDGDVSIFSLSPDPGKSIKRIPEENSSTKFMEVPRRTIEMGINIGTTPVVANGVLYIASRTELFAIAKGTNGQRRKPADE